MEIQKLLSFSGWRRKEGARERDTERQREGTETETERESERAQRERERETHTHREIQTETGTEKAERDRDGTMKIRGGFRRTCRDVRSPPPVLGGIQRDIPPSLAVAAFLVPGIGVFADSASLQCR
jgi:hypothetical protein